MRREKEMEYKTRNYKKTLRSISQFARKLKLAKYFVPGASCFSSTYYSMALTSYSTQKLRREGKMNALWKIFVVEKYWFLWCFSFEVRLIVLSYKSMVCIKNIISRQRVCELITTYLNIFLQVIYHS